MNKTIRIGNIDGTYHSLFCAIKLEDGRLSITGVEGPKRNGGCYGACGQIVMHHWNITEYAPGWDADLVSRFRAVWDRWHLNDMVAGSPAQMDYLRAHPIKDHLDYYTAACDALAAAGLHPDPSYLRDGKPYRYGSAWLREEVPQGVIDFLASLPDSDIVPAWI